MNNQIYLGMDLGGTNIKVGICDEHGSLVKTFEGPTGAEHGPEAVMQRIADYARKIVADSPYEWEQVAGIGAGLAGFLDIPEGIVKFSPNLRWDNVPVKKLLENDLGKAVRIDNDANVAALGEAISGAGADVLDLVCYTLGTGVGGGIIMDGRIYQGHNGMAGELGHISVVPDIEAIVCGCGQVGCLETVSSATGIIRMAGDAVERGDMTSLALLPKIEAKDVFDAAREGDDVASRIVNRAAYYLGRSMATLAVTLNPKRFIIGGGVSKAGDILFNPIRETFAKYTPAPSREGVDIIPAVLGNDAGVVGAACLNLR
ncbi:ROK family glucokinase [Paenibacillus larvae]|nr:ROK family glucokinase [Paenibacillus larvae]AQR78924.1 glucokinase [Paenibacillus larvae subsp. larvae]ARF68588.1 glucokinase [Paenibacillus larvae subsp. pulvifaciens]AVF24009.1 putative glucokinase [Paenibacillus larvae subsp. larvae]AVG10723.1 putative glucokinase [Paenibacillus larvae subsp. larvae DSM 25430]ETK29316.1 putative glucokinase [Paenibacillus larvae subsp. larvae DSM 25719]